MAPSIAVTDLVARKQTLTYFKKLGFSDNYIKQIEKELSQHERKLIDLIKNE